MDIFVHFQMMSNQLKVTQLDPYHAVIRGKRIMTKAVNTFVHVISLVFGFKEFVNFIVIWYCVGF